MECSPNRDKCHQHSASKGVSNDMTTFLRRSTMALRNLIACAALIAFAGPAMGQSVNIDGCNVTVRWSNSRDQLSFTNDGKIQVKVDLRIMRDNSELWKGSHYVPRRAGFDNAPSTRGVSPQHQNNTRVELWDPIRKRWVGGGGGGFQPPPPREEFTSRTCDTCNGTGRVQVPIRRGR
jgi:hypothetical protein